MPYRFKSFWIMANSYQRSKELRLYLQRLKFLRTMECKGLEDEGSRLLQNSG